MRTFHHTGGLSDSTATKLHRVPFELEGELEELLNANPKLLVDEPIFIFSRQPGLETGIPDLLGIDQYGNVVVFELKKGKSGSGSASEETILSQPQNYAQSLASFTYEDLNQLYDTYQDRLADGRWDVDGNLVQESELTDAMESKLGATLMPRDFNQEQRIVILAETITRRTRENARYLLEQGLHIQCAEVQRFEQADDEAATDQSVLVTSTPVDYDLSRVKPDRVGHPVYPERLKKIVDRAFPDLRSVVEAEVPSEVFDDLDDRSANLTSNADAHPDAVEYSIRIWPHKQGAVLVAVDVFEDGLLERLRDNAAVFQREGFEVNESRGMFRVVTDRWEVDSVADVDNEQFLTEVANRYIELVETGHGFFTSLDTFGEAE